MYRIALITEIQMPGHASFIINRKSELWSVDVNKSQMVNMYAKVGPRESPTLTGRAHYYVFEYSSE